MNTIKSLLIAATALSITVPAMAQGTKAPATPANKVAPAKVETTKEVKAPVAKHDKVAKKAEHKVAPKQVAKK